MSLTWDSIREGDDLPVLKKKPTVTQLVKYAAGSGDFNPLHHDYNFPQSKLIGSIIVSNYVFKCGVEILFTPVTYRVVGFLKRDEGIDFYDRETGFNPFGLSLSADNRG